MCRENASCGKIKTVTDPQGEAGTAPGGAALQVPGSDFQAGGLGDVGLPLELVLRDAALGPAQGPDLSCPCFSCVTLRGVAGKGAASEVLLLLLEGR